MDNEHTTAVTDKCVVEQMEEISLLRSMYSSSELIFPSSQSHDKLYVSLPSNFILRLVVSEKLIEAAFQIPSCYPLLEYPSVFIRSSGSWNETQINHALRKWIHEHELGFPMITDIIMWVQDNGGRFIIENNGDLKHFSEANTSSQIYALTTYARFYIFSHHLYSITKRTKILQLAKELGLSGFSTPGKPSVILVEGELRDCQTFWSNIKTWNWMRISLRHADEFNVISESKFNGFREILLSSNGNGHVHTSDVKLLLADVGLEDRFNILYNLP